METVRQDLLAVANAAFAIRCDDQAYDDETRNSAWDLWCLALELLGRHDRRLAAEAGEFDRARIARTPATASRGPVAAA
jgi:hypothetical protein